MKAILWIPLLVIIFVLFACQQKEESIVPISQLVGQRLEASISQLSQGEITLGIETLLDAIILTNPKGYVSDDFEKKIQEAKSEIQKTNMDGALEAVKEARFLLSSQKIEQEKEVDARPAPVAEAVKKLILSAKKQFQDGNVLEGVTSILDAHLLFKAL